MLPTLPIGPLRLQTHGVFLLVAYLAGLWLAARQAKRHSLDPDHIYNAGFYALIGGLLAARLGHAVAYLDIYRADPAQIISLSPGAFLAGPGVLGAGVVLAVYVWRKRLPAAAVLDALAPGLLLALGVAAVGAFLSGRTLGAVSSLPWAVALGGVRRHPAALVEGVAILGWLAVVLAVDRAAPRPPGWTALLSLFGYAAIRLFLEPLRAESAALAGGWRIVQLLALAALAFSGWMLGRLAARAHRPPAA